MEVKAVVSRDHATALQPVQHSETLSQKKGQVWWFTPVIPALGGQGRQIMRSGVRDQPGQHGEIPSLLKIQKLA